MRFFELTHRTTGYNAGGDKIDVGVGGRNGAWSIAEAAELIITGQAKFFRYDGELVTSLEMLPEKSGNIVDHIY
jgi:hypothetical protein